jgi:hypothetical protein
MWTKRGETECDKCGAKQTLEFERRFVRRVKEETGENKF